MVSTTNRGNKDEASAVRIQRKCFWSLILLSVAELFNFSAFITLEGLQSNVNAEVGMIALGLLYFAFLTGSMFLPPLVLSRLSCKTTLSLSTLMYMIYTAANYYPVAHIIIPAALLIGVGAALLWASLRVYITKIAQWYAEAKKVSVPQTTYWFFGTFFTIFSGSIIIGNLMTSFLTSLAPAESSSQLVSNVTNLTLSPTAPTNANESVVECGLFYHHGSSAASSGGLEQSTINIILMVFLVMQGVSAGLCLLLHEETPAAVKDSGGGEELELVGESSNNKNDDSDSYEGDAAAAADKPQSASKLIKIIFKILRRDKPAWLLIFMTMRLGFFWSFVMGQYTQAWIGCAVGVTHVTRCMALFGLMMAFSSMLSGQLAKCLSIVQIIVAANILENGVLISLFVWTPTQNASDEIFIFYVIAAGMGFTNGVFKSQTPSVYSVIWTEPDEVAASSALQGLWEALAATILYGFSGIIYPISQLILVIVTLNLGTVTLVLAWRMKDRADRMWS